MRKREEVKGCGGLKSEDVVATCEDCFQSKHKIGWVTQPLQTTVVVKGGMEIQFPSVYLSHVMEIGLVNCGVCVLKMKGELSSAKLKICRALHPPTC